MLRRLKFLFPSAVLALAFVSGVHAQQTSAAKPTSPDPRYDVADLLVSDDFAKDLSLWQWELEKGGSVTARDGALEIDVPGGCTVWLKAPLSGAVLISYDATMIAAGGVLAWLVYRYLGLKFVSRSWFNLNATWAFSLILVGALSLAVNFPSRH